jgi:hypothetical protein
MSFHSSPFNIAWRVSNVLQIPIGSISICISFSYLESPRWRTLTPTNEYLQLLQNSTLGTWMMTTSASNSKNWLPPTNIENDSRLVTLVSSPAKVRGHVSLMVFMPWRSSNSAVSLPSPCTRPSSTSPLDAIKGTKLSLSTISKPHCNSPSCSSIPSLSIVLDENRCSLLVSRSKVSIYSSYLLSRLVSLIIKARPQRSGSHDAVCCGTDVLLE